MTRLLTMAYGICAYVLFLVTFLWAIAFVQNVPIGTTIDGVGGGATAPLAEALVVNLALLGLFALQHSIMARRWFKQWLASIMAPAIERSTFVLAATAALALLLWQWRPITEPVVWSVSDAGLAGVLGALAWIGWGVVLVSTFLISHFELFGLQQVYARLRNRPLPAPEFRTPFFYRYVRHPIYVGFLLAFWSTPHMTAGHLLFAVGTTGYILVGIWFEERDLVAQYGDRYRAYREQVGMLLPRRRRGPRPHRSGS